MGPYNKAGFILPKKQQKEYERFLRTPFYTPCPTRYSVLYHICLRAVINNK